MTRKKVINKLALPQYLRAERVLHIIQRMTLDNQNIYVADIQEFLYSQRGNKGKHDSLYKAIKFLKDNGYVITVENKIDRRKKGIRINWNKTKTLVVQGYKDVFWIMLDTFYDVSKDVIDARVKAYALEDKLRNEYVECRICFNKSKFKLEEVEEPVAGYALYLTKIKYICKNCGFYYVMELYD